MRIGTAVFVALTGFGVQAHAASCPDLYRAIKEEAMYCDFFCDQRRLVPLQAAYETSCIVIAVPLSAFPFEVQPEESGLVVEGSTRLRTDDATADF